MRPRTRPPFFTYLLQVSQHILCKVGAQLFDFRLASTRCVWVLHAWSESGMLQMPFNVVCPVCDGHVFVRHVAIQCSPCCLFRRGMDTTAEQVSRPLSDSHALRLCTSAVVISHFFCILCMTTSSLAPLARLTANKWNTTTFLWCV